jgi:hypothetical protein
VIPYTWWAIRPFLSEAGHSWGLSGSESRGKVHAIVHYLARLLRVKRNFQGNTPARESRFEPNVPQVGMAQECFPGDRFPRRRLNSLTCFTKCRTRLHPALWLLPSPLYGKGSDFSAHTRQPLKDGHGTVPRHPWNNRHPTPHRLSCRWPQ